MKLKIIFPQNFAKYVNGTTSFIEEENGKQSL